VLGMVYALYQSATSLEILRKKRTTNDNYRD
jgi:hypothetical protein